MGTASDIAQLLARLQKGEVLQPPQQAVLLGLMEQATTGLRRLRGDLPAGTPVADKTGTGEAGAATNDVGLITLPATKGHLAMAVFISGSKLSEEAQEKLIAELARAAYDAHVSEAAQIKPEPSLLSGTQRFAQARQDESPLFDDQLTLVHVHPAGELILAGFAARLQGLVFSGR